MKLAKYGRGALLVAAAMGGLCLPQIALAQEARQEFKLDAGSLGDALLAVARQAGVEVVFAADTVAGKRAPRLHGTFTARQAIDRLLAGTELVAVPQEGGFVIRGRTEPSDQSGQEPAASKDIVVTGTHIRGSTISSPITVRTRNAIEAEGLTDLGSFARSLPQNYSGGQNPGVVASQGGSQNLSGSSNLNLRGLGQDATLTLINGHRVAYDAISQGVDISAIPIAAIERVEVVTDGSSAIYGSDAVGGVANIVLRQDFSGIETTARFGAATDGGDSQQEYSAVGGDRWNRGGFMIAGSFSRSTAITARQRSYTRGYQDSNTLLPEQKQYAFVIAGHQDLSDLVSFSLDGQYSHRDQRFAAAYSATADAATYGNRSHPTVESFTISPRLTFHLPAGWETSITGDYGRSNANLTPVRVVAGQTTRSNIHYDNEVLGVEANAEGPLFHAPGGTVRLAVGGGYRWIGFRSLVEGTAAGVTSTGEHFRDRRSTYFGYAEASIPLIGPDNRGPIFYRASIDGAIRYENIPGVGDIATPKVGALLGITPSITLSGTWGRSFKAPTLYQTNQAQIAVLAPLYWFQNPPLPAGSTVLFVTGGNRNLRPERAETWTATLKFEPSFVPGLTLQGSYFHVDYRDRVTSPIQTTVDALSNPVYAQFITFYPSAALLSQVLAGIPTGLENQSGVPYDPSKVGAFVNSALTNAAHETAKGVDLSATFLHDFQDGRRLNLGLSATYQESDRQISPGQPVLQRAGIIFNPPHWRGRFTGTWEQGNVALKSVVSYIGGTLDSYFKPPMNVGSFTSVDFIAHIKINATGLFRDTEVNLSVLNLLNEKPDVIRRTSPTTPPYDSTNYSAVGRYVGVSFRKKW